MIDGGINLFHQPFGGGSGPTDAYALSVVKPCRVYLFGTIYDMCIRVYAEAFAEEDFSIRTFLATYEEDYVVRGGKLADVGDAVGHLSADGVVILKGYVGRDVLLDVCHDALKLFERLCRLRV